MIRHCTSLFAIMFFMIPATAGACVRTPLPAQSESERRAWSREQTRDRSQEASERLASGDVDVVGELAELLVPNIRPVLIERSSCGPEGEIDFADGEPRFLGMELRSDYRLRNVGSRTFRNAVVNSTIGSSFGGMCNSEFRRRFADWLESELSEEDLRDSWRFLVARKRERGLFGSIYGRLMAFDRNTRQPPVRWVGADQWISRDIERFVSRRSTGRSLATAISGFWAANSELLVSDELACPTTSQEWEEEKERLVSAILIELENSRKPS